LIVQGELDFDDRDHYKNKRIAVAGFLLAELFQDRFKKMVSDLRKYMHECFEKDNPILFRQAVKTKYIKTGIANALKTGNWNPNKHSGAKNKSNAKQGVAQVLNRLTNLSTLSHLRRMNTPMGKEGQQQKARQLHNTQWGSACIAV
jgi:DNA-directed RNA polymerase II subunit RPB2